MTPAVVTALAILIAPPSAAAQGAPPGAPVGGRPFEPVVEGVVNGDLLLAGNSNLLSAGGWRDEAVTAADVDGDSTSLCAYRGGPGSSFFDALRLNAWRCADNSSSADVDLPAGARVLAARLYVETSVRANLGPMRVALDGPAEGFDYQILASDPPADATAATAGSSTTTTTTITSTSTVPTTSADPAVAAAVAATTTTAPAPPPPEPSKLYEVVGGTGDGAALRHAVWDLSDYVAAMGAGTYTVADIVSERAGLWLPYASWAIVVAYELDPAGGLDGIAPDQRHRFAPRLLWWHDGFQYLDAGSLDVTITGLDLPPGAPTFGKTMHVVAHGRRGRSDNLLFDEAPLGNNNQPGNAPAPAGVVLGTDPSCNTVTDVQNDTICVLGTSVATKSPGAGDFRSSGDGRTPASGSGVDLDVIRIPDGYLRAAGADAVVSVQLTGGEALAPSMIAVSIDVPEAPA